MMHKSNVWLVCCLVLFTVAPVAAQDHTMSIGIGYQFAKFNDVSFPVGASIDFEDRVVQQIALVGEVGWARNSRQQFGLNDITTHFHSAGGVRWVIRPRSRFEPFVQVLIGSERENINIEKFGSDSASAFLFQPGGGLIVHIHGRENVFGQVDLHRAAHGDESMNAARFVVGLRFEIR